MLTKVLGGVSVALVIAVFFLFRANASLNEEIGAAKLAIDQAVETNLTNQASIATLTTNLNTCVDDRAVDQQQNAITVANLRTRAAELETRAAEVRVEREEIFREPSCEELGNIDIAAVCPAWAGSLRERAAAFNSD